MKSLQDFSFQKKGGKGAYDWYKILDGGIYQLTKGEDFECEASTFGLMARTNASKQNKNIRVSQDEEAGTVVLQATPMSPEEKEANQAKLAKQKEIAAIKRAEKKKGVVANGTAANGVHPAVTAADAPPPAAKPVTAQKPAAKPVTAGKGK
jgi:hypothetical protein